MCVTNKQQAKLEKNKKNSSIWSDDLITRPGIHLQKLETQHEPKKSKQQQNRRRKVQSWRVADERVHHENLTEGKTDPGRPGNTENENGLSNHSTVGKSSRHPLDLAEHRRSSGTKKRVAQASGKQHCDRRESARGTQSSCTTPEREMTRSGKLEVKNSKWKTRGGKQERWLLDEERQRQI
jgi:hypothetical protein